MENRETIKTRLKGVGYSKIHEYNDPADEVFPDHYHEGDQLMIVLRGSIEVVMNSEKRIVREGDELAFPAKTIHSAKTGPEGCEYIVGEK